MKFIKASDYHDEETYNITSDISLFKQNVEIYEVLTDCSPAKLFFKVANISTIDIFLKLIEQSFNCKTYYYKFDSYYHITTNYAAMFETLRDVVTNFANSNNMTQYLDLNVYKNYSHMLIPPSTSDNFDKLIIQNVGINSIINSDKEKLLVDIQFLLLQDINEYTRNFLQSNFNKLSNDNDFKPDMLKVIKEVVKKINNQLFEK